MAKKRKGASGMGAAQAVTTGSKLGSGSPSKGK